MTNVLAILATLANVSVVVGGGAIAEVQVFGGVAGSVVSGVLAQSAAYVVGVTGNGGFIYNIEGFQLAVYFL